MAIVVDKDNTGVAFKNKFATSEAHPKFKGVVRVNGVQMHIAMWLKKSKKDDKPYISIQFQTEEEAAKYNTQKSVSDDARGSVDISEDELPF